eukprot:1157857-Pelagomonas_calceolata.AAC.1
MKLVELVIVTVPASVEDEHVFSAPKYLKSPQVVPWKRSTPKWLDAKGNVGKVQFAWWTC